MLPLTTLQKPALAHTQDSNKQEKKKADESQSGMIGEEYYKDAAMELFLKNPVVKSVSFFGRFLKTVCNWRRIFI